MASTRRASMPGGEAAWQHSPRLAAWAYDLLLSRFVLRRFYGLVVEQVAARWHDGRLLDVGTGPGWLLSQIAYGVPALTAIGVDVSPGMVRRATASARALRLSGRVGFVAASAVALPFADGSFDLALATSSLYIWDAPVAALAELYRVLAPGGEAWLYETNRDVSRAELDAALQPYLRGPMVLARRPIRWALAHRLAAGYSSAELAALAAASPFGAAYTIEPLESDRPPAFVVLKLRR